MSRKCRLLAKSRRVRVTEKDLLWAMSYRIICGSGARRSRGLSPGALPDFITKGLACLVSGENFIKFLGPSYDEGNLIHIVPTDLVPRGYSGEVLVDPPLSMLPPLNMPVYNSSILLPIGTVSSYPHIPNGEIHDNYNIPVYLDFISISFLFPILKAIVFLSGEWLKVTRLEFLRVLLSHRAYGT
ncbi:hypothetical protein PoB_007085300 [Plakobranchus ocellatus]|uniref:Uncharacterized protein n=1 Tax=Plakobranchus ocellatus TaxID=259542 RepID=A0AAV4DJV8_9GAST|nr:hypothetical protein PoB_007085300 [Plakobranchus ocellatus]